MLSPGTGVTGVADAMIKAEYCTGEGKNRITGAYTNCVTFSLFDLERDSNELWVMPSP